MPHSDLFRASLRFVFVASLMMALRSNAETATRLAPDTRQLLLAIAPQWSAAQGTLQRFTRTDSGTWAPVGAAVPVLFGKRGLAWGRGALDPGVRRGGETKREADGRTPAGAFSLGVIYGNDAALPAGADYPYHRVTAWDAWPDDPANPFYNRYVAVDSAHPPAWFDSQRMRTGDPAYRWRIEIRHNAEPDILPGAGSATFFHIRRGPTRPTAGCTTMAEQDLRALVTWLRASAHPHFVVLPRDEYLRLWSTWDLPAPDLVTRQ